MRSPRAALYARVSSEQQAHSRTIASQVASLRERITADGARLEPEHAFLDEGYSGATLLRPALERLRDAVAAGAIDRIYVHSPDRLARRYAYQVLLIEEVRRAGVEIVFLNRPIGGSAEDDLLLQVQGMIAEYERAKILERSRRGRRHAARSGSVSALCAAPFGYRYVGKVAGGGMARFEVIDDEARIVRQIFAWVGLERVSLHEVCRRLAETGCRTRTGLARWDPTTVCGRGTRLSGGPLRRSFRADLGSACARSGAALAHLQKARYSRGVDRGPCPASWSSRRFRAARRREPGHRRKGVGVPPTAAPGSPAAASCRARLPLPRASSAVYQSLGNASSWRSGTRPPGGSVPLALNTNVVSTSCSRAGRGSTADAKIDRDEPRALPASGSPG